MANRTELGVFLEGLRSKTGESLSLMATRLGMTRSYLSAIELGKRRAPIWFCDRVMSSYALERNDRAELFRTASRREATEGLHREVLMSVLVSALADYGDDFITALGADLVRDPDADAGPTATEVAMGLADACSDGSNRLLWLTGGEVEILASLISDCIEEEKCRIEAGAPAGVDFEAWLETIDYSVGEMHRCEALYEKLAGERFVSPDHAED